jgi:hypothetical protein
MNLLKGRLPKVLRFAALAVVVGGISTYVAVAAIPDAQGIIQACRLNLTGALRVIDTNESCVGLTETPLNWQSSTSGTSAPSTYTNRVTIAYGSEGSQTLLTLPGFGAITAFPCETGNSAGMNGYWQFTNSSGEVLEYYNPGNSSSLTTVAQSSVLTELTPFTVSLAPLAGSASKMATVMVHSVNDDTNGQCHYRVSATVTP